MEFKDLFEAIEFLFVEILFIPFDFIRLDISSWLIQNGINFTFMLVISAALLYWTLELIKYDKKGEEKKDVTAHSFL
ncbi:MAG: uracil phosphoribosyltransferase [Cryomorphaceae bacterium]|nr:MAG: uracil phosphoribosyltransferase [Cryomorphaceae bacterium]